MNARTLKAIESHLSAALWERLMADQGQASIFLDCSRHGQNADVLVMAKQVPEEMRLTFAGHMTSMPGAHAGKLPACKFQNIEFTVMSEAKNVVASECFVPAWAAKVVDEENATFAMLDETIPVMLPESFKKPGGPLNVALTTYYLAPKPHVIGKDVIISRGLIDAERPAATMQDGGKGGGRGKGKNSKRQPAEEGPGGKKLSITPIGAPAFFKDMKSKAEEAATGLLSKEQRLEQST